MGKIINLPSVSKHYHTDTTLHLLNAGYHDFREIRPIESFRVQKFYTWHFVLSGRGSLEADGKKYALKGGDTFFLPPDVKIRYMPSKEDPWEYFWFAFGDDVVCAFPAAAGFPQGEAAAVCRNFEAVLPVLKRLTQALSQGTAGHFKVLSAFFEIMDLVCAHDPLTEIQKVRRMIDESFSSPTFTVERLCRQAGISHAHLLRLFKKEYGVTLSEYVVKKRMELAVELLSATDLSVSSVAFSCGFRDEVHFMKTFKKQLGVPPGAFRRERTKKTE